MIKTIDVSHLNSQQIEEISNLIQLFENENKLDREDSKESKITLKSKTFRDLLKNQQSTHQNYDVEEAKWNYLKEKYDL